MQRTKIRDLPPGPFTLDIHETRIFAKTVTGDIIDINTGTYFYGYTRNPRDVLDLDALDVRARWELKEVEDNSGFSPEKRKWIAFIEQNHIDVHDDGFLCLIVQAPGGERRTWSPIGCFLEACFYGPAITTSNWTPSSKHAQVPVNVGSFYVEGRYAKHADDVDDSVFIDRGISPLGARYVERQCNQYGFDKQSIITAIQNLC